MLVSLEVRFQVIFGESFVDLEEFSIPGDSEGQLASPPQMDLLRRSVRLQADEITSTPEKAHGFQIIPTHDLLESRVVSWSGSAAVAV